MWIFLAASACPTIFIERLSFPFHSFSCFQWRPVTQSIGYHEDAEFRGSLLTVSEGKDGFHLLNSLFIPRSRLPIAHAARGQNALGPS